MQRFAAMVVLMCLAGIAFAAGDELGEGMVNPGFHEKPAWFKDSFLDIREDIAEAAEDNRRVMLYFYQDGCPYCGKLLQDNFGNRELASKTQAAMDVIAINMWGDREVTDLKGDSTTEKQFAAALKVQYTPTLLMLNEQGKVILRINGYFAPHKFEVALDYVAGRHETKQRFRDYYASVAPAAASGQLHSLKHSLDAPLRLADHLANSPRRLLVMFEQKTCKTCDELHQELLRRPMIAHALTNLDAVVVDIWSKDKIQTPDGREMSIRQWAKELDIQYAPSLVFFDNAGAEVFRTEAYLRGFHIHGAMDYVSTGSYVTQPNFQRYLQNRTDALHARGFEVDLMH